MRRLLVGLMFMAAVPLLSACGGGAAGSGAGRNPNVIGLWELEEVQDYNALEAIRHLRPAWLRTRSGIRPGPEVAAPTARGADSAYPRVHINGVPQGDIMVLEDLRADAIRELRFVTGPDASTRWGTGYTNGVILVTTER